MNIRSLSTLYGLMSTIAMVACFVGCTKPPADPPATVETPVPVEPLVGDESPVPNTERTSAETPRVRFETSMGEIELELYDKKAPVTVENFLKYVKKGHYDGTIFHRIIPGFMVQGGGMEENMKERPTDPPIKNESKNGLKNEKMTLSMARTADPNSASAQFFINLTYNEFLDRRNSQDGVGYCVFGKVTQGASVVNKMAKVRTTSRGQHDDVPIEPITLIKATIIEPETE